MHRRLSFPAKQADQKTYALLPSLHPQACKELEVQLRHAREDLHEQKMRVGGAR